MVIFQFANSLLAQLTRNCSSPHLLPLNHHLLPLNPIKPPFTALRWRKRTKSYGKWSEISQDVKLAVWRSLGTKYTYIYICMYVYVCIYVYMYTYICIYLLGSTYQVILIIYWFIYHNSPTFFLVIFRMGSIGTVGSMGDPQVSIGWFHGFFPSIDD